jgi:hypothetical protein
MRLACKILLLAICWQRRFRKFHNLTDPGSSHRPVCVCVLPLSLSSLSLSILLSLSCFLRPLSLLSSTCMSLLRSLSLIYPRM